MATGHPRKQLADYLSEHLPKSWRVIPEQRTYDYANKTTVVVKQSGLARAVAAPIGIRTVEFTLTVVSRFKSDMGSMEDDLDARVPEFLDVIEAAPGLKWTTATKVLVDELYLGYDIAVEVNTKKENL